MNEKMIDLSLFDKKIFSQHGEDGVIRKLFQIIGNVNYVVHTIQKMWL